jgi:hypothetical protein
MRSFAISACEKQFEGCGFSKGAKNLVYPQLLQGNLTAFFHDVGTTIIHFTSQNSK